MKKITKSVIAMLALAAVMPACKKGEEDPSISLRSRKGRVAGEWTAESVESKQTNTQTNVSSTPNYTTTTVTTTNYTSGSATMTEENSSTQQGATPYTVSSKGAVTSLTYTFEKDGTWKSVEEVKWSSASYSSSGGSLTQNIDNTRRVEREGTWQFLTKNKSLDLKNKEAIALSVAKESITETDIQSSSSSTSKDESTYTYGPNENVMIWNISMLKNKEMVVMSEEKSSSTGKSTNTDSSGSVTTNWSPMETTGTTTIKLVQ